MLTDFQHKRGKVGQIRPEPTRAAQATSVLPLSGSDRMQGLQGAHRSGCAGWDGGGASTAKVKMGKLCEWPGDERVVRRGQASTCQPTTFKLVVAPLVAESHRGSGSSGLLNAVSRGACRRSQHAMRLFGRLAVPSHERKEMAGWALMGRGTAALALTMLQGRT